MNKIVIYGAGEKGRKYYSILQQMGYADYIHGICDRDAEKIGMLADRKINRPETFLDEDMSFYVIMANREESVSEMIEFLEKNISRFDDKKHYAVIRNDKDFADIIPPVLGVSRTEFNRKFVAFWHVGCMDTYYDYAETEPFLGKFWREDTCFFRLFYELDLSNVIELGCGRGRHVEKYISKAGELTLVDVVQKNLDYCQNRFRNNEHIHYYRNNGYDLHDLPSDTYTSLFTYDAMVHFEAIDIYNYLIDIQRILRYGGKALFHHSNCHDDYRCSFVDGDAGRSYMSKELFAHLAYRAGFRVLEQIVIDWTNVEGKYWSKLDCVTLIEKSI